MSIQKPAVRDTTKSDDAAFLGALMRRDAKSVASFVEVGFPFNRLRDETGRTALTISIDLRMEQTSLMLMRETFRKGDYSYLMAFDNQGFSLHDHAFQSGNRYITSVARDSILLAEHLAVFGGSFDKLDVVDVFKRIAEYERNPGFSQDTLVRNAVEMLRYGKNNPDASSMLIAISKSQNFE